jgi:hypothetical protein
MSKYSVEVYHTVNNDDGRKKRKESVFLNVTLFSHSTLRRTVLSLEKERNKTSVTVDVDIDIDVDVDVDVMIRFIYKFAG